MGCCCSAPLEPGTFLGQISDATGEIREWLSRGLCGDERLIGRTLRYRDVEPAYFSRDVSTRVQVHDENGQHVLDIDLQPDFGKMSVVRGTGGKIVAALKTMQANRPISGLQTTSFCVFSCRPLRISSVPRAPSFSVEGVNMFPWATVTRTSFTNKTELRFVTEDGHRFEKVSLRANEKMGFAPRTLTYQTMDEPPIGLGLGLRSDEKPKRHELTVSSGVDSGLLVVWFYATYLLLQELPTESKAVV